MPGPSTASLINEIVLSILRLLVLGLVFVVPRLACRACPLLNTPDVGDVMGEPNVGDEAPVDVLLIADAGKDPNAMASSSPLVIGVIAPDGEFECEDSIGIASSDSGSTKSGGRRSFSMSDFRLCTQSLSVVSWETNDVRVFKRRNGLFDAFRAQSQRTIR